MAAVSGRGSGTRRARQAGGRARKVTVRLSDAEYEHVGARAAAARLTPASFLAAATCEDRSGNGPGWSLSQRRGLAAKLAGTETLLRRAADNLNRLTRIAQASGALPVEVPAAADAVRRHVQSSRRIAAALDPRISSDITGVDENGEQLAAAAAGWAASDPLR